MSSRSLLRHIFLITALCWSMTAHAACNGIKLLQPIGGLSCISAGGAFGVFETYFNAFYSWFLGAAAGIALLMVVTGGLNIIQSGGDQTKRQEGIDRLKWAIIGLLVLLFSSIILQTLNPTFYH